MANSGIFRLFWRHFVPMCKRCLRLTFRRNNRVALTLLQTNINEQIKQQFSCIQVELHVKNALAVSVNKMHFPIFEDDVTFKISFYATPETKVIKVTIIGLFQFKTYHFPVSINTPQFDTPSVSKVKRLKNSSVYPLLTPQLSAQFQIKSEHIQQVPKDRIKSIRLKQIRRPIFIESAQLKGIDLDEIENEITHLRYQYNEK